MPESEMNEYRSPGVHWAKLFGLMVLFYVPLTFVALSSSVVLLVSVSTIVGYQSTDKAAYSIAFVGTVVSLLLGASLFRVRATAQSWQRILMLQLGVSTASFVVCAFLLSGGEEPLFGVLSVWLSVYVALILLTCSAWWRGGKWGFVSNPLRPRGWVRAGGKGALLYALALSLPAIPMFVLAGTLNPPGVEFGFELMGATILMAGLLSFAPMAILANLGGLPPSTVK